MKASRAYIAGLGTSGVLIGSFVLLLAVVSTIVAFRGAPGEASNRGLDRLDMSDSRQAAHAREAAERRADGRMGDAAAGRGDRRAARRSARAHRDGRAGGTAAGTGRERIVAGLAETGSSPSGRSGTGGADRQPSPDARRPGGVRQAPSLGDVAGGVGGAVEETTGGLGETVGTVAPPLEAPVDRAGEAVSGVTDQAGPVVDRTVDGATGAVDGTVDQVTGVAEGVTGGLGGGG